MKSFCFICLPTLFAVFSISFAANGIPSSGIQTAQQFRSNLPDTAFRLRFQDGTLTNQPNFSVRSVNLGKFPVLAAPDVQSALSQVSVNAGASFLRHSHPRSSEIIYVTKGLFRAIITFEGSNPRIVSVDIKAGEATVFPQGLIHEVKCMGMIDCAYVAVFTSADPGFVSTPAV